MNGDIATKLGSNYQSVSLWRRRFALLRLKGIEEDAPRTGRPSNLPAGMRKRIIDTTLNRKPEGETHWSTRSLAGHLGVSHMTVQRVWKEHGLQPHRTRSFKLSNDPRFEEKLVDVAGLYMHPPEKAVVFSVDEKPQIQALERTQKILPLRTGMPECISNDYKRNGTVDLYAALNILDGTIVTQFSKQHTHREFLSFLNIVDSCVEHDLQVHVVIDNLSAHDTPEVKRWLKRHRRFHFHFVPTGSSWVNMVEGWFSKLTGKAIKRGSFRSITELKQAIEKYVDTYNNEAKPWIWTKDAKVIMKKIKITQKTSVTGH